MKQKQWLTLKEIEEYWGYSGEFIKYLIATHRLPALRLRKPGTPIVIREDWWEKFCQAMDLMLELSTTAIALDNLPGPLSIDWTARIEKIMQLDRTFVRIEQV